MAGPVTFAGGFAQGFQGGQQIQNQRKAVALQREQARTATLSANRKTAQGFIDRLLAVLKAGGKLSPELVSSAVETASRLDPERASFFQSFGENLGAISVAPIRGTPEDIEATRATSEAAREPAAQAAERAGGITGAQQAVIPGAGKRIFSGTTPDGKRAQFQVDLETETVTQITEGGIPLSVQASTPGALVGGKSAIKDLRTQETATRVVLGDIQRMKQQLSGDKTFTSVVSGGVRTINSLVGTALQAASLLGFDDRGLLDPGKYEFEGLFGEEAAKSAAFKSIVVKLAYALARSNDPSARLSDPDIQNALKQLGTASGSKETIAAVLDEVAAGAVRGFRATFKTFDRQSPGVFGEFPPDFDELLKPLETEDELSQEDLEFTAKKHGISVEEVKRRLREVQ